MSQNIRATGLSGWDIAASEGIMPPRANTSNGKIHQWAQTAIVVASILAAVFVAGRQYSTDINELTHGIKDLTSSQRSLVDTEKQMIESEKKRQERDSFILGLHIDELELWVHPMSQKEKKTRALQLIDQIKTRQRNISQELSGFSGTPR